MTGYQSKKALSDRMNDAIADRLFEMNEWQLGMSKLQKENEQLRAALHKLTEACDCWNAVQERRRACLVLEGKNDRQI